MQVTCRCLRSTCMSSKKERSLVAEFLRGNSYQIYCFDLLFVGMFSLCLPLVVVVIFDVFLAAFK